MEPSTELSRRRMLRKRMTEGERLLWNVLRGRRFCGLKFRRQYSIGSFIVDFACLERAVVIEIDGGYHELTAEQDRQRQEFIESQGYQVIRFWNDDVLNNLEGVVIGIARQMNVEDMLREQLQAPHPTLSPEYRAEGITVGKSTITSDGDECPDLG